MSRNMAIKKREISLLQEYQELHKINSFVDRRIGESDETADPEERALARFAREWRKNTKRTILNLDDDLTHLGKSLSEIDVYDDVKSNSGDEDDKLPVKFIKKAHFGGEHPEKSHKDIMQELILETKQKKYERQSEREANENLTDKLDKEWKELQNLVAKSKQVDNIDSSKGDDAYDLAVRSLKFEIKGKPSDRLKTEEELDKEEKGRISRLEAERQKRMQGESKMLVTKVTHIISADSLHDGLVLDNKDATSDHEEEEDHVEQIVEVNSKDNSGGDDNSSDNESSVSDENIYEGMLSDESHSESEESPGINNFNLDASKYKKTSKCTKNLPDEIPTSLEDLCVLFANRSASEKKNVLEELIRTHHPSLGGDNIKKIEDFFNLLLQYLSSVCTDPDLDFSVIDSLTPVLYNMLQMSPVPMSRMLLEVISQQWNKFQICIKKKEGRKIPFLDILILFKFVAVFYPTSDFHHPLVTASELFMSEILVLSQLTSLQDISRGLFICCQFLEYVSYAKRFVPEVIKFLKSVLFIATSKTIGNSESGSTLLSVTEMSDVAGPMPLKWLAEGAEIPICSKTSVQLLSCCIGLVNEFAKLYSELPSFLEIFQDFSGFAKIMTSSNHLLTLKPKLEEFQIIMNQHKTKKFPLLQCSKPVKSIKMYEPCIQADFTGKKQRPVMSAKKAERQKLLYKYKKEFKGAVREIRRDNQYLSRLQLSERMERDSERKQKTKRLFQDLAQQECEFKRYKKKKR